MKELQFYKHTNGNEPVKVWLKSLDIAFARRVTTRFIRLENDNFGDYKKIDDDIYELRFAFGSGYRVYFSQIGDIVLVLLCAGDKKPSQKIY